MAKKIKAKWEEDCGLTRMDAQKYLGVGSTLFYELLNENEFPNAYYVGSSVRIPMGDLKRYRNRKNFKKYKPKENYKRG